MARPAAGSIEPMTACHVLAVPYPGRGHVNPMMNLCKLLINSKPNLLITFVITEEWFGLMGSDEKPSNIRFATIPNVLPSEHSRAADMLSFVGATQTKMGEPFELLLDHLEAPPVNIIIADTFLNWAVEVGNRRNIPVASLWPMPASVFSIFYHFGLLVENGHYPFDLSERGKERVEYIPGIASIRLADIPVIAHRKDQRLLRLVLQIFTNVSKAQYLLFTSVFELEPQAIHALKQKFPFPLYTIDPAIPYFSILERTATFTNDDHDQYSYIKWLNSQPPNSVLYVSLGSFLSVSTAQMDEIADGLRESGIPFLWVARGEAERLNDKFCGDDDRGRVVGWCDEQLRVLCHPSVGGFWSHCGWNSAKEGMFAGVPMICFPIGMDQTTICKHIVEDWKIGLDAKKDLGVGDVLRSQDVCRIVESFMDLESFERKEMAAKARRVGEVIGRAILDGGSCKTDLNSFLDGIYEVSRETFVD